MLDKVTTGIILTKVNVSDLLNEKGANEAGGALNKLDQLVKGIGAGSVNIFRNAFVYIAVVGLLISAICLVIHGGNVAKRADERSGLVWKVVGIILGFAAVSIVVLAQTIGGGLFG